MEILTIVVVILAVATSIIVWYACKELGGGDR